MSRLGGPPRGFIRRPGTGAGVRANIAGLARGLGSTPFSPGTSEALTTAAGISQALGLTTQTGYLLTSVGNYEIGRRREEAAEVRRAEAIEKEKQDAIEDAERGQAVRDFNEQWPTLADDVASGRVIVPAGQSVEEYARSLVSERLPEDVSEAYRQRYSDLLTPRVIQGLVSRRAGVRQQLIEENVSLIGDEAKGTKDAAGLRRLVGSTADLWPDSTETERLSAVVVPALRFAADAGDAAQFEAASEVLGDRFPEEIQRARAVLENRVEANRRDRSNLAVGRVLDLLTDGTSIDAVRAQFDNDRGQFEPDDAFRIDNLLDAREEEQRKATLELQDQTETALFQEQVRTLTDAVMDDPGLGTPYLPEQLETVLPSGKTLRLSKTDFIEQKRNRVFADIAARFPDATEQIKKRLQWIGSNPEVRDPQMEAAFAGLMGQIPSEAEAPPKRVLDAFDLYRTGRVLNKHVTEQHFSSADDRNFFQLAEFYAAEMGVEPGVALMTAHRFLSGDNLPFRSVDEPLSFEMVDKATRNFAEQSRNGGDVARIVSLRARAYAVAGFPMDRALDRAAEDFQTDYDLINGRWVRTAGKPIIRAIDADAVTGAAIRHLAGTLDDGTAVTDLSMAPDPVSGAWRIIDDTGFAVPGSPVYSDDDLRVIDAHIRHWRTESQRGERVDKRRPKAERDAKAREDLSANLMRRYDRTGDLELLYQADALAKEAEAIRATLGAISAGDPPPAPARLKPLLDFIRDDKPPVGPSFIERVGNALSRPQRLQEQADAELRRLNEERGG